MTDAAAVHACWSQGPHRLRFPYGISLAHDTLAAADTANNRVFFGSCSAERRPVSRPRA
jgi:hypothetical protein